MRLEWAHRADEKAKFLEEKSSKSEGEAYGPLGPEFTLSESIKTFMGGDDPKIAELRKKSSTLLSILGLVGLQADEIYPSLNPSDSLLKENQLANLVNQIKSIVIQVDIRREPFVEIIKRPREISMTTKVFFIYIEDDEASVVVRDPVSISLPILSDMPKRIQEKIKEVVVAPPAPGTVKEKLLKRKQAKGV
jgi:hypothetical protein